MKKFLAVGIVGVIAIFLLSVGLSDNESPFFDLKVFVRTSLVNVGLIQDDKTSVLEPVTSGKDFVVTEFITGLDKPTTMSFVGEDILVLQKNDGTVRLIRDGKLHETPVLDVEVSNVKELGMLGILSVDSEVFLYFTESDHDGGAPIGNHIYKYQWNGEKLIESQLVNVLPAKSFSHVGGVMVQGIDGKIFAVTGDQTRTQGDCQKEIDYEKYPNFPCRLQGENIGILHNIEGGEIDDTSVIILVGHNSSEPSPLLSVNPVEHYFAIGIRNSFGLAIDPFTGNLWATENGPDRFDEINLVYSKFNSGWKKIMGPATESQIEQLPKFEDFTYSDPKFSWELPANPTGISFIDSPKFEPYHDSVLVGDCYGYGSGHLYLFKLNSDRTEFVFDDPKLGDLVVDIVEENGTSWPEPMDEIVIAENLGCITDIEFGPDGYPYVVSHLSGKIFKIIPSNE